MNSLEKEKGAAMENRDAGSSSSIIDGTQLQSSKSIEANREGEIQPQSLMKFVKEVSVKAFNELVLIPRLSWQQFSRIVSFLRSKYKLTISARHEKATKLIEGKEMFAKNICSDNIQIELQYLNDQIKAPNISWLERIHLNYKINKLYIMAAESTHVISRKMLESINVNLEARKKLWPETSIEQIKTAIGTFSLFAFVMVCLLGVIGSNGNDGINNINTSHEHKSVSKSEVTDANNHTKRAGGSLEIKKDAHLKVNVDNNIKSTNTVRDLRKILKVNGFEWLCRKLIKSITC